MVDHEGIPQIDYDDISMRTKPVLTRFGGTFGTLRFDERSFFNTLLGFISYWDYKPTNAIHADSPGVCTSEKMIHLNTTNEMNFKCIIIDDSVVIGIREPILF